VFYLTSFDLYANVFLFIVSLYGAILFVIKKFYNNKRIAQIFGLVILVILISIVSAKIAYNQDYVSGLIANRSLLYMFSPFAFYKYLKSGYMNTERFWKVFRFLLWGYAIYIGTTSLLNVSYTYISPLSGNITNVNAGALSKDLIFFGIIYYTLKLILNKKWYYGIAAVILFIITQLYDIQRGDLAFLSIIIFLIFFKFRKTGSIKKTILFLPLLLLFLGIILVSQDSLMTNISNKFSQAFKLFNKNASQNNIEDASVFIRIYETQYAMLQFKEHPITGNGVLRPSFRKEVLPDAYFYPADIGIIGILYTFGIMGITLFIIIGLFIIKLKNNISFNQLNVCAFFFFILYMYMYSFKDGNILLEPVRFSFILITLLSLGPQYIHSYKKE